MDVAPSHQLSLTVVYDDVHLIQVECAIVAGGWSGGARAYTTKENLHAFALAIEHFGQTLENPPSWEAGADNGIGLISLRFYIVDRAGRICCFVRLATETATQHRAEEVRRLELATEAQSVIEFGRRLATVAKELTGDALLVGAS